MKRSLTAAVGAALILIGAPTIAAVRAPMHAHRPAIRHHAGSQTNWAQIGFDATHAGYNPYETTLGPNNVGQLEQAWSFATNSDVGSIIEGGGAVFIPSANGTLYAVDASTGSQLWSVATGTGYTTSGSAPAYDSGLVFSTCTLEPSGNQGMCAYNASSGSFAWSYAVAGVTSEPETPPVVANGDVYFGACGTSCAYVALNETNGALVWSASESQTCELNNGYPAAVYSGAVYAVRGCQTAKKQTTTEVIALNASSGSLLWHTALAGTPTGISVGQGLVAVTAGDLYTFNPTTGSQLWYSNVGAHGIPAIAYDIGYVGFGSWYMDIYAQFSKHGGKKGKKKYTGSFDNIAPYVAAANGVLYTVGATYDRSELWYQKLGAMTASTYEGLWNGPTYDTATLDLGGAPIVADGVVYGACGESAICAWALPG